MVKEIVCANGEIALCDDEDYPLLSRFSWFTAASPEKRKPYPHCNIVGKKDKHKRIPMHQLVMGGAYGSDHKDGNGFNNQKHNLREATYQQNGWNSQKQKTANGKPTSSQYKGVFKAYSKKYGEHWAVRIKTTPKGVKPINILRIGPFYCEEDAARAYNAKVRELRGEWAWLNPVEPPFPSAA